MGPQFLDPSAVIAGRAVLGEGPRDLYANKKQEIFVPSSSPDPVKATPSDHEIQEKEADEAEFRVRAPTEEPTADTPVPTSAPSDAPTAGATQATQITPPPPIELEENSEIRLRPNGEKVLSGFARGARGATKLHSELKPIAALTRADRTLAIRLRGHTDGIGDSEINYRLGLSRARFVRRVLIKMGVPRRQIFVESAGDTELIAPKHSRKNRRVEIAWGRK